MLWDYRARWTKALSANSFLTRFYTSLIVLYKTIYIDFNISMNNTERIELGISFVWCSIWRKDISISRNWTFQGCARVSPSRFQMIAKNAINNEFYSGQAVASLSTSSTHWSTSLQTNPISILNFSNASSL